MTRNRRRSHNFFCFSPPVMVATLLIELCLAVWLVARYKLDRLNGLLVAALASLAIFQFSEYFICTGAGHSVFWSQLGFASITLLPPLGLHIVSHLAGVKQRWHLIVSYAVMLVWVGVLAFFVDIYKSHNCTGNYVTFGLANGFHYYYGLYYYGLLLLGIGLAITCRYRSKDLLVRKALLAMVIGYLVFLVPTVSAILIWPEAASAIPSIMCGFAVLLALILAFRVAPLRLVPRSR